MVTVVRNEPATQVKIPRLFAFLQSFAERLYSHQTYESNHSQSSYG